MRRKRKRDIKKDDNHKLIIALTILMIIEKVIDIISKIVDKLGR
ncbi:hypothetical protein [Helcococcus ovis]|nr:hypothetical protein [Helcococcus ovis]WNZ00915.1 hypothetical protein EQF90_006515 [Helcococcus ovis]